jgi:hypothetical protein
MIWTRVVSAGAKNVIGLTNSRLRHQEASLWLFSKNGSSFAITEIPFCISNHSSNPLSGGCRCRTENPERAKLPAPDAKNSIP